MVNVTVCPTRSPNPAAGGERIFSKEEFLKRVNVVDKEMKKRKRRD